MGSALMAWVCIGLTLAQLNNAESHRDAHGHLAGQDELFQQLFFAAPEDSDRSFRAPVWNFLHVEDPLLTSSTHLYHHERKMSDINQPQYRCSNGTLFLRFSLIRYSNLRLEDGVQLLSLPDRCHSSISIYRWWLLVKLPTGCYTAIRPGDGTGYHPVKLHYFDHLLQEAMTGMAVCENPVVLPQAAPPLVTCRTTHVTVKLPHGTKLRKVKELGKY
ncbi:uncharacterized protein LOC127365263 [Dicentrarchus labrax]|uniref:uncharacterized protein LOC127365263 n=1 Tax=Dicentrarchus labrax TaxID=13489 RepID=UPI0021F62201|nr:uncharacterized protein LOC127365263 [Dicentrarchus labrax]